MRLALPNRRLASRFKFHHGGIRYYATLGFEPDGEPREIFLQGGKAGSAIEAVARDTAVFASLALQYGCPLEVMQKAITRLDDGSPAGPGGRLLDLIAEGAGA